MGHYKVIFLGLVVAGPEEETRLLKGLQKRFKLTPEKAESLLQRVPIVVKKGTSLEEMEKYVKAFEEMGGKVRLEEEAEPLPETKEASGAAPEAPPQAFTQTSREAPDSSAEPWRKPYAGKKITCPQCGFEQPETDDCIKCGIIISKYRKRQEEGRGLEDRIREIPPEEKTPWESGEGFFRAFFKTVRESLFSSGQFYRKSAAGEGYLAPLIYGVITGVIGWGGSMFWQLHFFSRWFPIQIFPSIPYKLHLVAMTIALPFFIFFWIIIKSTVMHICLLIVGGNKNGFEKTFRAISYSYSGHLFGIIPFIGSFIGGTYTLVLTIIGIREVHGISTGRAVLAVLLPLILAAGLGIIAAIFLPLFLGSVKIFGGVGV